MMMDESYQSNDSGFDMLELIAQKLENERAEPPDKVDEEKATTKLQEAITTTKAALHVEEPIPGAFPQQGPPPEKEDMVIGAGTVLPGAEAKAVDEKAQQGYYSSQLDNNNNAPGLTRNAQQMDHKAQQGYYSNQLTGNGQQGLFGANAQDLDRKLQQGYYSGTTAGVTTTTTTPRNHHIHEAWAGTAAQNRRGQGNNNNSNNQDREEPQPSGPGAYALAPSGSHTVDHPTLLDSNNETSSGDQGAANQQDNSGLAVATEVDEDYLERSGHLQQAEEYNESTTSHKLQSEQQSYKAKVALGITWLLCLVIGAVLLATLTGQGGDDDIVPATEIADQPIHEDGHSLAPSTSPLLEQILGYFPNYTIQALEDLESPQSQALDWLLDDPNLLEYIDQEWRVKQRFALVTMYYSTRGFNWTDSENWLSYSHHECLWFDSGSIPFPLPGTGDKYFTGENLNPCHLPNLANVANDTSDEILLHGDATNASYKQLWLHMNNLEGLLPEEIYWLTSLKTMSLFFNNIYGPISSEIGHLQEMQAAIFSFTGVGGTIPTEIGLLSNTLAFFLAEDNNLEDTLPTELGQLSPMETLLIDFNQLTGTIPQELFQLSNLEWLYLSGNPLSGTLPSSIGILSNLEIVLMAKTLLTGTVPTEIGGLERIENLHLQKNQFTGQLPSEIGRCSSLLDLSIEHNSMNGPMPSEIGMVGTLLKLSLYGNQFNASIPTELGLLSSVLTIEIQNNTFYGPIPSEIAALPNMTHFFAQENMLTGIIPEELVLLLESNGTVTLKGFNVSDNLLVEEETLCWINETYHASAACLDLYNDFVAVAPFSCECHCFC